MSLTSVLVCLLVATALQPTRAQQESCAACNCPLDSDDDLDSYVRDWINRVMGNEPLPRILQLVSSGTGRVFSLRRTNMTTLSGANAPEISSINIGDGNNVVTTSDNILSYRPNFNDGMNSNLAGLFMNLEAIFPCISTISAVGAYYPICRAFTNEEDGFRGGRAVLDTGDIGNGRFRIFSPSQDIATYAMAIQQCPTWTTVCFPPVHSFSIVCYLPRSECM